jgi:hypothetical protein
LSYSDAEIRFPIALAASRKKVCFPQMTGFSLSQSLGVMQDKIFARE